MVNRVSSLCTTSSATLGRPWRPSQAAGLVTQFNTSPTMMRFRKYSIDLYMELGVFQQVGSLRIASTQRQLDHLKRSISQVRGIGLEVELL